MQKIIEEIREYVHSQWTLGKIHGISHWDRVYENGQRAAVWIDTLRNTYLKDVSDEEIRLLKEACRLHTIEHKTGNPTIDACFDSDRLDLWRVGIIPDPDRLATEKGKEIASNTDYAALIHH